MIKLPFFKQDTEYSCGPAAMQMVFRFYGKVFSEQKLIEKLKTDEDIGTNHKAMVDFACSEGFYVYVNNESTLEEVASFVERNIPVIIHFIEPCDDDEHYSVIVGINKDHVTLHDPWNGKEFEIGKKEFEQRWHSKDCKKWILVMSTEDLHLGKQYLPK